jgi:hypothetical protein
MTMAENIEEDEMRETKYPHLRVMRGGKGPPEAPAGKNWLADLEVGTTFACRQNDQTCDWEIYHLLCKMTDDLFLLKYCLPDGKIWDRHVDPKIFCKVHKLHNILGIHKHEEEPEQEALEEIKDEQRDRTD